MKAAARIRINNSKREEIKKKQCITHTHKRGRTGRAVARRRNNNLKREEIKKAMHDTHTME